MTQDQYTKPNWSRVCRRLQLTTNEKDVLQSSTQYGEEKRVFNEDFCFKVPFVVKRCL
jgi:hypothetical protein